GDVKATIRNLVVTKSGHILIELSSSSAADWLRSPKTCTPFVDAFFPGTSIRKRTFTVVIGFVPVEFTPEDPASLRTLEIDHGLQPNDILEATWIKHPSKRAVNQALAHIKVKCASAKAANHLLISPLHILGRQVTSKKDIREPSVCNKCQKYGHYMIDCKEDDTCARCGEGHRVTNCPNRNAQKCTPCGSLDHPTNHFSCLEYQKRVHAQNVRAPESLKPFFPTDEQWTWDDAERIPW
ncbi:hypothetical protein M408DRAFT_55354, partial [Serendipita vermifera MAFF 305830]